MQNKLSKSRDLALEPMGYIISSQSPLGRNFNIAASVAFYCIFVFLVAIFMGDKFHQHSPGYETHVASSLLHSLLAKGN